MEAVEITQKPEPSDAELVERIAACKDFQKEGFGILYGRYSGLLLGWCRNNAGKSDAEDLAQAVWTKMWEVLIKGTVNGNNFRGLLFTTARNLLRDKWRRMRLEPILNDDALNGTADGSTMPMALLVQKELHKERTAKLTSCLKTLLIHNKRWAEVAKLKLKAVDVPEICAQLSFNRDAVDKAWHGAKHWLRSCVGQEG
jgi:RNA polymerase sigma factor (sigma-70 family)